MYCSYFYTFWCLRVCNGAVFFCAKQTVICNGTVDMFILVKTFQVPAKPVNYFYGYR